MYDDALRGVVLVAYRFGIIILIGPVHLLQLGYGGVGSALSRGHLHPQMGMPSWYAQGNTNQISFMAPEYFSTHAVPCAAEVAHDTCEVDFAFGKHLVPECGVARGTHVDGAALLVDEHAVLARRMIGRTPDIADIDTIKVPAFSLIGTNAEAQRYGS